jgi:hypothetical protein
MATEAKLSGDSKSNYSTENRMLVDPEKETREDIKGIVDKEIIDLEEKRRRECEGNMEKIEKEFADLKEKFFTDKIESLKRDYDLIKSGTTSLLLHR